MAKRNRRLSNGQRLSLDVAVRAAHLASMSAATDEAKIAQASLCSPAVAFRVAMIRRVASPMLLHLWTSDALTYRQLARICLIDAPLFEPQDEEEQLRLARHYPAAARALGTLSEADAK